MDYIILYDVIVYRSITALHGTKSLIQRLESCCFCTTNLLYCAYVLALTLSWWQSHLPVTCTKGAKVLQIGPLTNRRFVGVRFVRASYKSSVFHNQDPCIQGYDKETFFFASTVSLQLCYMCTTDYYQSLEGL